MSEIKKIEEKIAKSDIKPSDLYVIRASEIGSCLQLIQEGIFPNIKSGIIQQHIRILENLEKYEDHIKREEEIKKNNESKETN